MNAKNGILRIALNAEAALLYVLLSGILCVPASGQGRGYKKGEGGKMNKLKISSSPHIRHKDTTRRIMLDVILALVPAAVCSIFIFGYRSLLVMGLSILTAVASEYICLKIMKRKNTVSDLSAVVTGLLYALVLPVGAPVYVIILGSAFAIVIAKQCFGGLGANILNPRWPAVRLCFFPLPAFSAARSIISRFWTPLRERLLWI